MNISIDQNDTKFHDQIDTKFYEIWSILSFTFNIVSIELILSFMKFDDTWNERKI